jgi:hypothetical protein
MQWKYKTELGYVTLVSKLKYKTELGHVTLVSIPLDTVRSEILSALIKGVGSDVHET